MVYIHYEKVSKLKFLEVERYKNWLNKIANSEDFSLGEISLIFCTDEYLLKINQQYLQHDYYTDIITFDYSEEKYINGDLFISVERVLENSVLHNVSFKDEINRVIAHGVLHLCKYKDKTINEQKEMREKENKALNILKNLI